MDRLSRDLEIDDRRETALEGPAIPLNRSEGELLARSAQRLTIAPRLFALDELDVLHDTDNKALWTFMRPRARPSFTPPMLADFEQWQQLIAQGFGPGRMPLDYLVLGSRTAGVFCYGGDLELFARLILSGDRDGLVSYGRRCVEILDRNIRALDLPMVTIGLVQGSALGGGFEALLSFDFIIAERGASFGLPEIKFGLFPGMGAHALLTRKLGSAQADRMILGDRMHSAEEMYDLGLVHHLAEPGEGVAAVRDFMARSLRHHAGIVGARRASRLAAPVEMAEFYAIVDVWADVALQLSDHDLRLMQRFAGAQQRLAKAS